MTRASTTRRERPPRRSGRGMYHAGNRSADPSLSSNGTASTSMTASGSAARAKAVSSSSLISIASLLTTMTVPPPPPAPAAGVRSSVGQGIDEAEVGGAGRIEQRAVVELVAQHGGRLRGGSHEGVDDAGARLLEIVQLRSQRRWRPLDAGDMAVAQRDGRVGAGGPAASAGGQQDRCAACRPTEAPGGDLGPHRTDDVEQGEHVGERAAVAVDDELDVV